MHQKKIKERFDKARHTQLYLGAIILLISTVVFSIFLGFNFRTNAMFDKMLLEESRALKAEISIFRQWVWKKGGVYVSSGGQNNRSRRQIVTEDGEILRNFNPAEVTQELSRMSSKAGKVHFTGTSLFPINPQNKVDSFERRGLEKLASGDKEFYEYDAKEGMLTFRYMTPLHTKKSCMECHINGGFKPGQVDSALSFSIPADEVNKEKQENRMWMLLSGLIVIGLVVLGIWILSKRFLVQLEKADEEMKRLASEDELTKLLNRRMGLKLLQSEIARCERSKKPLSLVMLDIDYFKKINDTMGHLAGDEGLRELAKVMKATLRDYDIPFRYGGEEFFAILPNEEATKSMLVAERLREAIQNNKITTSDGQIMSYTVSLGIAQFKSGMDVDTLISNADTALYQAKDGGRNQSVLYKENMTPSTAS